MNNKLILSCVVAVLGAFSVNAAPKFQNVHLIKNADGTPANQAIGAKVTLIKNSQRWTSDTVYIIDRLTFVEAPAVLTIEPGTIIRMENKTTGGTSVTDPADVGTIIICRGAKIVANGTAESPIIITNIDDEFVPGGVLTIPNNHNGVTDNATYASYSDSMTLSTGAPSATTRNYTRRDYITGNKRFEYDATCGGLIILGKTPVAFGNPQLTATGQLRFNVTDGGSGYEVVQGSSSEAGTYRLNGTVTRNVLDTVGSGASLSNSSATKGGVAFNATGGIKRVVVSNVGSYTSSTPPTITFTKINDGIVSSEDVVTPPTYTVQMVETSAGSGTWRVSGVTITNPGAGYASATLTFTGGDVQTPATGNAVIGRSVVQLIAANTGTGYSRAATIGITYDDTGLRAPTSTANLTSELVAAGVTQPTAVPNATSGVGANFIEGFQSIDGTLLGTSQTVGGQNYTFSGSIYGGSDDDDNSGTLRFVSLRYGGFVLSPNNEINGLTTGAVGRSTSFEFIEVVNNADDDIEHFGGSVDMKYVAGLFGGDDGIDLDQGYRGRIQFAFQIQNNTAGGRPTANIGDCLGEWDGPEAPVTGRPYTVHTLFNFTGIGTGNAASAGKGINYKDNSGGKVFNSIFADAKSGLTLTESSTSSVAQDATGNTAAHRFASIRGGGGVYNLLTGGTSESAGEPDAMIRYTSYRQIGTATTAGNATTASDVFLSINRSATWGSDLTGDAYLNDFAHNLSDFEGIARVNTAGGLDPRLVSGSSCRNSGIRADASGGVRVAAGTPGQPGYRAADPFYTQTQLRGAFRDCNWLSGWSLASEWGLLSNNNCLIPAVRLSRASGVLGVAFTSEKNVEYSVETSPDGKKYLPFTTVKRTTGDTTAESSVTLGADTANAVLFVRVMPL